MAILEQAVVDLRGRVVGRLRAQRLQLGEREVADEPVGGDRLAVAVLAGALAARELGMDGDVGRGGQRDVVARDQHAVLGDDDVGLDHVHAHRERQR